ncbi:MAG: hypothetical protein OEV64_10765, partial [Desulfobulbaceae bacterium]|nr:hypothetical protein [Desulfobulbaceae bacterium]
AGDRYIQIHNFIAHQKPHHREQASVIPPPGSLPQLAIPMAIVRPTPADTEPLPDAVPIPDFIDKDLWRKYLEWSRNERGWTVSIVEQEMQLALLKSIHDEGLDANESIRKTISGRYKTFFPPNTGKKITNLSSPDERGQSQEYVVKPSPLPDGMTCGECYKFGQQCEPDGKRDGTETECRWTPSFFARRAA